MKNIIHIIPTLQNGGAETVLARIVEEFSKNNVEQIVITLQGINLMIFIMIPSKTYVEGFRLEKKLQEY